MIFRSFASPARTVARITTARQATESDRLRIMMRLTNENDEECRPHAEREVYDPLGYLLDVNFTSPSKRSTRITAMGVPGPEWGGRGRTFQATVSRLSSTLVESKRTVSALVPG